MIINHFKTKGLFFINAVILLIVVSGYFIWNNQSVAANSVNQQDENTRQEKQYYKDLIYTVNEMNNQIQHYEDQFQNHKENPTNSIQEGLDKVQQLIQPLSHPPQRFEIAYMIANDMYKYYSQYVGKMTTANSSFVTSSERSQLTADFRKEYQHFRDNYQLLQIFDQFKSLDIDCH